MKQSKKLSAYESATNVVVGLLVSILAQMALYPLMGIKVSFNQNLVITAVFFVLSFARGYIIRRLFNKICVHERKRWWWTDGKKWYLTQKHKDTYLVLRCNNCGKILKEKDEYN
jgi:hypothetical protein